MPSWDVACAATTLFHGEHPLHACSRRRLELVYAVVRCNRRTGAVARKAILCAGAFVCRRLVLEILFI